MRLIGEMVAWWALCFGLWLLTLSTVTTDDVALALAAGLLSAACAIGGRHLTRSQWAMRWRWTRWLAALPVAVAADTVGVLARAYRRNRVPGSTDTIMLPSRESMPLAEGRGALASLVLSASPASYVFDRDPDHRVLHVHRVGTFAPAWARPDPAKD
jgi:multisubunit Na+/H+ antiporter MnhE subunit